MAISKITKARVRALRLLEHQQGLCFYCGYLVTDLDELTLDHLVPRSKSGSNRDTNLVASCRSCNQAFADLPVKSKIIYLLYTRGATTRSQVQTITNPITRIH